MLNGCDPGQSRLDDKKEPHYVLGESRVNAMDYQGAIDAFEQSLEVNPRSAAAHFELACLFDEKVSDPAAAIYHYRQYLKLDPGADNAEVVTRRINSCKQQLAADVMAMPSAPAIQQQLEKQIEQNRQLQDQLAKWQAYAGQLAARTNTMDATPQTSPRTQPDNSAFTTAPVQPRTDTATPRTHVVAAGETEASISRKFGVKLSALQAANPGVKPSKLRVGQVLNIPPP